MSSVERKLRRTQRLVDGLREALTSGKTSDSPRRTQSASGEAPLRHAARTRFRPIRSDPPPITPQSLTGTDAPCGRPLQSEALLPHHSRPAGHLLATNPGNEESPRRQHRANCPAFAKSLS